MRVTAGQAIKEGRAPAIGGPGEEQPEDDGGLPAPGLPAPPAAAELPLPPAAPGGYDIPAAPGGYDIPAAPGAAGMS